MSDTQDLAPVQPGELVVVTGMTGAGRSPAAKELEDLGYFVVDNLPPSLLPDVVRLVDHPHDVPHQGRWEVVDHEVAEVLQLLGCRAAAGTGHAGDDDQVALVLLRHLVELHVATPRSRPSPC